MYACFDHACGLGLALCGRVVQCQRRSAAAVDAIYVYWATPNAIGRASLDGSNPDPQFIERVFNANALAVDRVNQYIYWADINSGYIGRAPLVKGTIAVQTRYFSTLGVATGLAIDYKYGFLYWSQNSIG